MVPLGLLSDGECGEIVGILTVQLLELDIPVVVALNIFDVLLHLPWGVESRKDSYLGRAGQAIAPALAPARSRLRSSGQKW